MGMLAASLSVIHLWHAACKKVFYRYNVRFAFCLILSVVIIEGYVKRRSH